jgi:hypothetical protein
MRLGLLSTEDVSLEGEYLPAIRRRRQAPLTKSRSFVDLAAFFEVPKSVVEG